jgi:hypothetical protein
MSRPSNEKIAESIRQKLEAWFYGLIRVLGRRKSRDELFNRSTSMLMPAARIVLERSKRSAGDESVRRATREPIQSGSVDSAGLATSSQAFV